MRHAEWMYSPATPPQPPPAGPGPNYFTARLKGLWNHPAIVTRRRLLRWTGWMVPANALVLQGVGLAYLPYVHTGGDGLGALFLALAFPGQFLLLSALLYPLSALAALALPRRGAMALTAVLYGLLALVLVVDTRVFALYRFHLNSIVWNLLFSGVAGEVLPLSLAIYMQVAAYLAGLVAVEAALAWGLWWAVGQCRRWAGGWVALACVALVLSGHVLHAWADANNVTAVTKGVRYIPWAQMTRAGDFFAQHGWISAQAEPVGGRHSSGLDYPRVPLECRPPVRPLNILMLVIDGWRFDHLSPEVSPNAWALGQQGWRFQQHFSTSNETRYGIFGILYGLDATYWDDMLGERRGPVLIDMLKEAGYRFGIYGSAPLTHPEFDLTAFAALKGGFPLSTPGDTADARDRAITGRFAEFLRENSPRPFFAFLFYDSPHQYAYPRDFPAPFQPVVQGYWFSDPPEKRQAAPIRNAYMNSTRYADSLIGQALAALAASGHAQDTVVLVTGDHGEEFNDLGQNYWGHAGDFSRFQMQTPLVVRWPGRGQRVIGAVTSHVDIAPTLLSDVLGCTTPPAEYSNGRNLLDATPRPYVVGWNGIRLAVAQPDRITVVYDFGGMDVLDLNYREIPGAVVQPQVMRAVIDDTQRFYRR